MHEKKAAPNPVTKVDVTATFVFGSNFSIDLHSIPSSARAMNTLGCPNILTNVDVVKPTNAPIDMISAI